METPVIKRLGIVGAGNMGARIAFHCLLWDKEVYLYDIKPQALERAVGQIRALLADKLGPDQVKSALSRLHPSNNLADCVASVELVIEAVYEDTEVKRQVFGEIDRLAPPRVLIGTYSSAIPSSRMAEVTSRPDKVFNINMGDPTEEPFAEIMVHPRTSRETMAAALEFARSVNMVPIVTKREIIGFTSNRVWRAVKKESLHLVANGYADFEDVDRAWMMLHTSPRGPFALMDRIGLDIIRAIEMQYYLESGDERDKPPQFLDNMIAQRRLGMKSGRGFYSYPDPEYRRPGWLRKEAPWSSDQTITLPL